MDVQPSELLPHHEEQLRASGISIEVIVARGYRSASKGADLQRLGFSPKQARVPALLLPIRNNQGEIVLYQARPDEPRIDTHRGKPIKYETPAGCSMRLDIPAPAREWLRDPRRPLFITEGIKKADSAVSHGLCCVALLGVWNWRGKNQQGGIAALSDWDDFPLKNRIVYLAFDSDVMEKPEVYQALSRLKSFLDGRGATTKVLYLPPGEGGKKQGLDDFLVAGGSVEELLSRAATQLLPAPVSQSEQLLPYKETEQGLVWNRSTREGVIPTPLTNFTARIVADVKEDDGAEVRRLYEIEARLNGRVSRFTVSALAFHRMDWVYENMGASALLYPGQNVRDQARFAIQSLSGEIPALKVYAHMGWSKIGEEWFYLHPGGGIGANGQLPNIQVNLPSEFQGFSLPPPTDGEEEQRAVRASLDLLQVISPEVAFPLLATIFRAPLGGVDFSVHLCGPTGAGKSALATLAQQHWGPRTEGCLLSWSSTENYLEAITFVGKDTLLVVDDFIPIGTLADKARMTRKADRLLRAQGNHSGRGRLSADGNTRSPKPPRGLLLSTGEDIPSGQSLQARILALEVASNSVDFSLLSKAQAEASSGTYAQAMAGFIHWLAPHFDEVQERLRMERPALRDSLTLTDAHRRASGIYADLLFGFGLLLEYGKEIKALSAEEEHALMEQCEEALRMVIFAQSHHQSASNPARQFIRWLSSALMSGRAHLTDLAGGMPVRAELWGWKQTNIGRMPQGKQIGWVDEENIYLDFPSAFAAVQVFSNEGGESFLISEIMLKKHLYEKGVLASTELRGGKRRYLVRRLINGVRRDVLHLQADTLFTEVSQVSPVFPGDENGSLLNGNDEEVGPQNGDTFFTPDGEVPLESGPAGTETSQEWRDNGTPGTPGTLLVQIPM